MLREIWNEISPNSRSEYPKQSRNSYLNKEFVLRKLNFSDQTKSRDCHLLTKRRVATRTRKRSTCSEIQLLPKLREFCAVFSRALIPPLLLIFLASQTKICTHKAPKPSTLCAEGNSWQNKKHIQVAGPWFCLLQLMSSYYHRIIENLSIIEPWNGMRWQGLLKITLLQPSCHGQGHLRPGCSKPQPTWTLPGMGHRQLLWATGSRISPPSL